MTAFLGEDEAVPDDLECSSHRELVVIRNRVEKAYKCVEPRGNDK